MELIQNLPLWQLFVIIGALLCLAEVVVPGFVILPLGLGFLIAAPFAYWLDGHALVWAILVVLQLVSTFLLRMYFKRLSDKPKIRSTAEGMIGKQAVVSEEIPAGGSGYVKLYGDQWMAKSFHLEPLAPGTHVVITKIDGNKVWVEKEIE